MANQYEYLVPRETAGILKQQAEKCQNFGLTLKRYTPHIPGKKNQKHRDDWLRKQCNGFAPAEKGQTTLEWQELLRARYDRWKQMVQGAVTFELKLQSRLVVGLGGKGSLEIGLTLDHVTGLPYIPGSALKGVCRNYVLLRIARMREYSFDPTQAKEMNEALNALEQELISDKDESPEAKHFRDAFGTQQKAGAYIFYDAVPTGRMESHLFAVDVMTPHFPKYYRGEGKLHPNDADDPNPVSFPTVNSGVEFAFAVGLRHGIEADLEWSRKFLLSAIKDLGLGAKTAAGYGYFTRVNSV